RPVSSWLNWFVTQFAASSAYSPLSHAAAKQDFDRTTVEPGSGNEASEPRVKAAADPPTRSRAAEPAPRATLPPLADAFAALLAAEQSTPASIMPAWPASAPAPPVVTEDLIEEVTRRVLERLSDRVVRDTVSEIVAAVAERLVREEIDRIKSSIK